jgi:predicted RNA-binding Zn ribbon-like protein
MSWHLVDGVPLPDPVAGHPALDFCNTRAGWGEPLPKEYLTTPTALTLWAVDAGLIPAADPTIGPATGSATGSAAAGQVAVLTAALAVREALHDAALDVADPGAWDLLGHWAGRARTASRLLPGAGGAPARWELDPDRRDDPELPLLAVAAAADAFLTSPLATAVAACPGVGCGWLFTDPRHRRRWCSMAVCGNRAKARRHADRRTG